MENKILMWLRGYFLLERLAAESVGTQSGDSGVFFLGEEILQREENLLGGALLSCRYRCNVRLRCGVRSIDWMNFLGLQDYIGETPPPELGVGTAVRCKELSLLSRDQAGTALYQAQLEFTYRRRI